jgi:hypothetical protein
MCVYGWTTHEVKEMQELAADATTDGADGGAPADGGGGGNGSVAAPDAAAADAAGDAAAAPIGAISASPTPSVTMEGSGVHGPVGLPMTAVNIDFAVRFADPEFGSLPLPIEFDGDFESGNIKRAERVVGALCEHRLAIASSSLNDVPLLHDDEYDVRLREDVNTRGNIQWFYFCVTGTRAGRTVKFNLVNHNKSDSLLNYGMKPLVYSCKDADRRGVGWVRGGFNVCYYMSKRVRSGLRARVRVCHARRAMMVVVVAAAGGHRCYSCVGRCTQRRRRASAHKSGRTTSWRRLRTRSRTTMTAYSSRTACHTRTATWSERCRASRRFPSPHSSFDERCVRMCAYARRSRRRSRVVWRDWRVITARACTAPQDLCQTLAGNTCQVITITASTPDPDELRRRRGVVITARVHPGETNSSWMMHGVLMFLTSNAPEARLLRQHLVRSARRGGGAACPGAAHAAAAAAAFALRRAFATRAPWRIILCVGQVFKIIPMLNPDGVIAGNYRCGLAGVDLNRRWGAPSKRLHASVHAAKNMMRRLHAERPVGAGTCRAVPRCACWCCGFCCCGAALTCRRARITPADRTVL